MHPTLLRLGHLAIPTQGVLAAIGLLLGLELAISLGKRLGLSPDRLWNLGLATLATYFFGERLLVIAVNLGDFAAHPLWMLGLTTIRDERYTYSALVLALIAAVAYIAAWRLPWRTVLDAAAPGAGLALALLNLGALAAGANPGRPTAAWGVVYLSRAAARAYGTPLGTPLAPITLYAALAQLALTPLAAWLVLRKTGAGTAAATWLFGTGLVTILLEQLRYPTPDELLVFAAFTPAQTLGILAVAFAGFLLLPAQGRAEAAPRAHQP